MSPRLLNLTVRTTGSVLSQEALFRGKIGNGIEGAFVEAASLMQDAPKHPGSTLGAPLQRQHERVSSGKTSSFTWVSPVLVAVKNCQITDKVTYLSRARRITVWSENIWVWLCHNSALLLVLLSSKPIKFTANKMYCYGAAMMRPKRIRGLKRERRRRSSTYHLKAIDLLGKTAAKTRATHR